jgi:heat-inducible transcriptional repressor
LRDYDVRRKTTYNFSPGSIFRFLTHHFSKPTIYTGEFHPFPGVVSIFMGSEPRLSPRERTVLTAVVETYIATGEPVASQALARHFGNKDGMSSATIRNVMASLADAGLLDQPHTSAGRIPTARAFRFYVEHLGGSQVAILTPARLEQIEESFAGIGTS